MVLFNFLLNQYWKLSSWTISLTEHYITIAHLGISNVLQPTQYEHLAIALVGVIDDILAIKHLMKKCRDALPKNCAKYMFVTWQDLQDLFRRRDLQFRKTVLRWNSSILVLSTRHVVLSIENVLFYR